MGAGTWGRRCARANDCWVGLWKNCSRATTNQVICIELYFIKIDNITLIEIFLDGIYLALNISVHFFVLLYAFGLLHVVDIMLALQIDIWVDIFCGKNVSRNV